MGNIHYHEVRKISTIKELISSSTKLFGDNAAFKVKNEKGGKYQDVTYKVLKHQIEALGTKLIEMGLKGSKIAIIGDSCYEWVLTYLTTINGVGIAVPLDKELPEEELHSHIRSAECDAIFYAGNYGKSFENLHIKHKVNISVKQDETVLAGEWKIADLIKQGAELLRKGDKSYVDIEIDPYAMTVILFTSGTTESSKGVMLSHNNLASNIMATSQICKVYPTDTTLSILPIHHTFECTLGIMTILYAGASVAFCEGLKYIAKNMVEAKVSILVGVPLIFEGLYEKIWKQAQKQGQEKKLRTGISISKKLQKVGIDARKRLFKDIHEKFGGRLRLIITGAAGIDPNVCRGFEDFGLKVLQGYGLTETAPLIAGTPDTSDTYKKAGSVGPAIPGVEIKIIDKDEDGIGEIICRGPNTMLGYFNDPERTANVLKDGWFYTGDLGFFDNREFLYIAGRKKNVIVTKNGKNIYPEEVEYYLNSSKYIEESFVEGLYDEKTDETIVSAQLRPNYEEIKDEFGVDIDDDKVESILKGAIDQYNDKMPIYKRVRNFVVRKEEFVKTTTKKIKRQANTRG